MMRYTQDMAVQILVTAKLIREEYLGRHAIIIQRFYRKRRGKPAITPFRQFRRGMVLLQSHYRRRKASEFVTKYRDLVGTQVKRFLNKAAILVKDCQGRFTKALEETDQRLSSMPTTAKHARRIRLLDVQGISEAQRLTLIKDSIAPIQALAKHNLFVRKITDVQRRWRSYLAAKNRQHLNRTQTKIAAVWRTKVVRLRLARMTKAAVKLQAQIRRIKAMNERRQAQEQQIEDVFAQIRDLGEEVVQGRRIQRGGSVCY